MNNNENLKKYLKYILSVVVLVIGIVSGVVSIDTSDNETNNYESYSNESIAEVKTYKFRNNELLSQHYEKHGIEMGFSSAEEYEKKASDVVNSPNALHKIEAEDGDDVYYIESTNDFVIVSKDGYIRTYFYPNDKKEYFDRQ